MAETNACQEVLGMGVWIENGYNVYDISDDCKDGIDVLCYGVTTNIAAFLNAEDVRQLIGAPPVSQTGNYSVTSWRVNEDFARSGDGLIDNKPYVAGLLERGIDVLVYAGELDAACQWLGNLNWVQNLDYSERTDFKGSLRPWSVDGREVGQTARGGGLSEFQCDSDYQNVVELTLTGMQNYSVCDRSWRRSHGSLQKAPRQDCIVYAAPLAGRREIVAGEHVILCLSLIASTIHTEQSDR